MSKRQSLPADLQADIEKTIERCIALDIDCTGCRIQKDCCGWCDTVVDSATKVVLTAKHEAMRRAEWAALKPRILHVQHLVQTNTKVDIRIVPASYSGSPGHPIPAGCTARDKYARKR